MRTYFLKTNLVWLAICMLLLSSTFAQPITDAVRAKSSIGPVTAPVELDHYAKVYYVSAELGSDTTGNGSSDQPWQSISFALSQMTDADSSGEYALFVAAGTYSGQTIHMREYVEMYGGFNASNWERDIFNYKTILDGEEKRRVLIAADHAKLNGFCITNGMVRGKGAGILCESVSPKITNSIFTANQTLGPDTWEPKYLHEVANDGAAIYCVNGASPVVENNLFARNKTEIGRGAGIALQTQCSPKITNNVFMENVTGLQDHKRSSDGGAISVFDRSNPIVTNNIILNNRALTHNDGGGVFVALWSSAAITGNILVGNKCGDDAGALFVGGQEHRYDRPLDPLPTTDEFFVSIINNIFIGNENPSQNSGAMRFTMESRGLFANNVVAFNNGIYFQRSEVAVVNNTILDNFLFVETKQGLKPGKIINNIIWAEFDLQTEAEVRFCDIKGGFGGTGNIAQAPIFADDRITIKPEGVNYYPGKFVTNLYISNATFATGELTSRVIKAGDKWGVVQNNDAHNISVWGDLSFETSFDVLPTYHLSSESPCIDAGTGDVPVDAKVEKDMDGDKRSVDGKIDIGADERNGEF